MAACSKPEDPARAALRQRLTQAGQVSPEELARVREEVSKALVDKKVRIKNGTEVTDLTDEQNLTVLGMLVEPAGMFDEGLREEAGVSVRVLNSAGLSESSEVEASRRLLIDIETFLPRRFLFTYAFPGYGDYEYELVVE